MEIGSQVAQRFEIALAKQDPILGGIVQRRPGRHGAVQPLLGALEVAQ
jgi:hypothetical protein